MSIHLRTRDALVWATLVVAFLLAGPAAGQRSFVAFESGPVRPLALSPDGSQLFAVNTPDNRLEIFATTANGLRHDASVPVGMEPVAVAARTDDEIWVVNHLSDSVSIVDVSTPTAPRVVRTLLVGDEPRDIVFAQGRAFITTAHRGQHRTDASISSVVGSGDPELTTPSVGRADVWVFNATNPGAGFGGTPDRILIFFGDTPRALATDGTTVYAAVFHSGNQTAVVSEGRVCDGFGVSQCSGDGVTSPNGLAGGNLPGGNPGPATNHALDDAPEVGLVVKYDNASGEWRDEGGRNWSNGIRFNLPDHDVFAFNASTLATTNTYDHVGTILYNMVVNPTTGSLYVSNQESPNLTRFEGPGDFHPSTVQGRLSEARVTVITSGGVVKPRHVNNHIDYGTLALLPTGLPNPAFDSTQKNHSLATLTDMAISSDGSTLYTAAFGSSKVGVFDTADLENDAAWALFDPTAESADDIALSAGGPGGIVLDESKNRLYVATRFNNGVSVVELGTGTEKTNLVLHNPEPDEVVDGRHMLYDAFKTSGNGEASCSSCHIFGDMDSLSWDLGDPDGDVAQSPIEIRLGAVAETQIPDINGTGNVEDFHPMKGPMTTQTLRGLATHGHMHWRGDRVEGFFPVADPEGDEKISFKNFIVAFPGLVGGGIIPTDANLQDDVDDFADFMLEVILPPNPVRALDNSLNTAQDAGRNFYLGNTGTSSGGGDGRRSDGVAVLPDLGFTCEGCHTLDPANGHFGGDGKQSFEMETQTVKIPQLRNLYQKVGMFGMPNIAFNLNGDNSHQGDQVRGTGFLHDGSTDSVFRFLTADVFAFQDFIFFEVGFEDGSQGDDQREDMEQFMLAFDTDLAPIVGQQVTLAGSNVDTEARIGLMETRAQTAFSSLIMGPSINECDVVAKGTVAGESRGYLFDPGTGNYESDRVGDAPITPATLIGIAGTAGQEITYTCAPPGSGVRMGIDRDLDGFLDSDERDASTDPANAGSFSGACSDGQDNDGDGLIDLADPGCADAGWDVENPACNDGVDNDSDALIDLADPNCGTASRKKETKNKSGCGLGAELWVLLPVLAGLRVRRRRAAR